MLREKLNLVPLKPGCYLMKDINNNIIYVGKALNLKNRLSSYFNGTHTGKTLQLVNNIHDFEYIVTSSELEAFLLELNLIKKYMPKYNILLKDDKSYPYIELTTEKYPTLNIVRNINRRRRKDSKLFGPYPNAYAARKIVDLLNRVYPLKKCNNMPKKECLYYHLGECLGYCVKKINSDEIEQIKKEIIKFLNGDHSIVTSKIKEEMNIASEKMMYEKAIELKELLTYIEITLKEQTIDLKTNDNLDVFGYYFDRSYLSVQIFFIRGGKIIGRTSNIYEAIDIPEEEIMQYITNFYSKNNIKPKEIIVPNIIDKDLIGQVLDIKIKSPSRGKYKKLLDMANKNAKINFLEKWEMLKNNDEKITNALNELCIKLGIEKASRIELFDNSNLFGTYYVSGMVVFIDGKKEKNEYRKFKISNPNIKDDISAMKEVIYRRYFRVLMDNLERPDLIIIDGGKSQVNITREVIHSLGLNIPIAGLKKNEEHNTNELIGKDPLEIINIDKRSFLFNLLATMQEEVHRFSITYHKVNRSKGALASTLDLVSGIGDKRRKLLLRKYGSLSNMKKASIEELTNILPENIALNLYNFLQK